MLIENCIDSLGSHQHAIYEHTYQDDSLLIDRCKRESVRGASCFNEEINILELIEDIIYDAKEVIPWLKTPDQPYLRLVREYPSCGKKFLNSSSHNWDMGPLLCDRVVVILGKIEDQGGCVVNMHVRTAYPE